MSELIIHYSPAHIAELLYFRHNVHKQDDIIAMGSSLRQISFLILIIHLVGLTLTFAQPELLYFNCTYSANYSSSSTTYGTNLNTLLSSLSSNIDRYGYYNSSFGEDPDRVTAVVLCRGDVEQDICRSCVDYSTRNLTQLCPNQREAIAFYQTCMLRYTNQAIEFGKMVWGPGFNKWNIYNNVSDEDLITFHQVRETLFSGLIKKAASGDSHRKFETGEKLLPKDHKSMYALVQCTPDLSGRVCTECLNALMLLIPQCCNRTVGGAVYKPTCNLRYELDSEPFYNRTTADAPPPLLSMPPPPQPQPQPSPLSGTDIIIIVASIVIFVIFVVSICIYLKKRKQRMLKQEVEIHEPVDGKSTPESVQYEFATVRDATDNFSDTNKLGEGGFGPVYKGRLSNGQEIAVKRLSIGSGQGEAEFKNEVLLVAKLRHRNLVRLLGFSLEGTERLLIYELVKNGSLDGIMFDTDTTNSPHLDWDMRYKIIRGIAKGLLYLHEDSPLRIIHRDLKASNILLDAEMNPKISDFGLARSFVQDNQTQGNTIRPGGTPGYMAPEAWYGNFSVKSDVFSFGVLVLEIVSGQKIRNAFQDGDNEESLLSYAWRNWREGTTSNLIQSTMRNSSGPIREVILRCIHIGLLCVQENVANRPKMDSVVLMLGSSSVTLPAPSKPAFISHSGSEMEMPLLEASHNFSVNEASITELYPR